MNPEHVLERKQEREQRQHAKSRQGKQERARAGIEQLFKGEDMTQDESLEIEELLMIWYKQALSYWPQLDVPAASVYAKDYRTSETKRHGNDASDDADEKLNTIIAESVEACLDSLQALQRSAVEMHCAAKHSGCSVIRNPRMTLEQHHQQYQAAKRELWPMFRRRELMR